MYLGVQDIEEVVKAYCSQTTPQVRRSITFLGATPAAGEIIKDTLGHDANLSIDGPAHVAWHNRDVSGGPKRKDTTR
eukprot:gene3771-biopygen18811